MLEMYWRYPVRTETGALIGVRDISYPRGLVKEYPFKKPIILFKPITKISDMLAKPPKEIPPKGYRFIERKDALGRVQRQLLKLKEPETITKQMLKTKKILKTKRIAKQIPKVTLILLPELMEKQRKKLIAEKKLKEKKIQIQKPVLITKPKLKKKLIVTPTLKQKQKLILLPALVSKQAQKTAQEVVQETRQIPILIPIRITKPAKAVARMLKQPTIPIPKPILEVPPPPPPPPPGIIILPRGRGIIRKKKKKKRILRRPTRYKPTIVAHYERIFGRRLMPKEMTGIEIRPIPRRMLR